MMGSARPRRLIVLGPLAVITVTAVSTGCGKQALEPSSPPSSPPPTVDVVVATPDEARAAAALAAKSHDEKDAGPMTALAVAEPDPEPAPLSKAWADPAIPRLGHDDALARARTVGDAFGRLLPPPKGAPEPVLRAWFMRAQSLADQSSRMYAAAFHAEDAAREDRTVAIAEAAEQAMAFARALDDAGLDTMPKAWRTDPALASTFEDVATGPTRRWRDEARALARQCVRTAREEGVETEAARRCADLRTGLPAQPLPLHGAATPCACDVGDPLCSASLSGWCGK